MLMNIYKYAMLLLVVGLLPAACCRTDVTGAYPDGIYRGVFIDRDEVQVNVQLELRNGVVEAASYRHLQYGGLFKLNAEQEPQRAVVRQFQELLDGLVGRRIDEALPDLFHPERLVKTEVDGFTAATVRGNKVHSAIRDALNRGVYEPRR